MAHNPRSSKRLLKEKPPLAPGVAPAVDGESGTALPLPHERDEVPDQAPAVPDPRIRQAAKDLRDGQVDTDMRATPGLDAQRRGRLVPGPGGRPRRRG
jgi:hypothetical protein